MHAILDLQYGSKSLFNIGDLLAGQSRTKISAMGTIRRCCQDFFWKLSLLLLLITPRSTISILQIYCLKKYIRKFLSMPPLLWVMSEFGAGRTCGGLPGGAWSSNLLSSAFRVSNKIDIDHVLRGIIASWIACPYQKLIARWYLWVMKLWNCYDLY